MQLSSIAFFGRGYDEYLAMFAIDPESLAGGRVADIAAGPSSFTAECRARGLSAVAVDPLYGLAPAALAAHVQLDYRRMAAEMRRRPERFRLQYFASLDAAEASRRAAADRFLADYDSGFAEGRYVGAALPRLPFPDQAFDVVLCAHLLFLYGTALDFAWHVAACRELARLGRTEARVHPICGLDGKPYPELPRLLAHLADQGVRAEIRPVAYRFFAGADQVLVLRREP